MAWSEGVVAVTFDVGVVLGAHVRDMRKARSMSQQQLADRIGIARVNLARLEHGRHTPMVPTLIAIADALGVTLAQLVAPVDAAREGHRRRFAAETRLKVSA